MNDIYKVKFFLIIYQTIFLQFSTATSHAFFLFDDIVYDEF